MSKLGTLKTWSARAFAVLVALSALVGSNPSSETALVGSLLVYAGFVALVFKYTGGDADGS